MVATMVEIYLFIGEDYVGQRSWPMVPRLGESMILLEPAGTYEVTKMVWHDKDTGLTANVHLKLVQSLTS
jgi:hypothetical protein